MSIHLYKVKHVGDSCQHIFPETSACDGSCCNKVLVSLAFDSTALSSILVCQGLKPGLIFFPSQGDEAQVAEMRCFVVLPVFRDLVCLFYLKGRETETVR